MFNDNCPNLPATYIRSILGVDVAGNTLTTMSTQLQLKTRFNMVEEG